jgi:lysophospholipase L1-like esterase
MWTFQGGVSGKTINVALFMVDGLHPNEKGYEVLGKYLSCLKNK